MYDEIAAEPYQPDRFMYVTDRIIGLLYDGDAVAALDAVLGFDPGESLIA